MKNLNSISRPRGRPRSFDRDEALAQAAETFWRLGYEGASVVDLTAAMGITPQSFYSAFHSKADLYREAIAWYGSMTGAMMTAALTQESSARAAFRRVLSEAVAEFTRTDRPQGCMIATAALNCGEEHRDLVRFVADQRAKMLDLFERRAEQGIADGDYPAESSAKAIARHISALMQGYSVQALDGASQDELIEALDAAGIDLAG